MAEAKDMEKADLRPIPIETSSSSSDSSRSDVYALLARYWPWMIPLLIVVKILGAVIFLVVIVYLAGYDVSGGQRLVRSGFSLPLMGLRERIHYTSRDARSAGSLHSRKISTDLFISDGMKFLLCQPVKETDLSLPSPTSSVTSITTPPDDPLDIAHIDEALVVHRFAEDSTDEFPYTLVLNKYNTIPDHALLVSDDFSPQSSPITTVELMLLYWAIRVTGGVGWYNSNQIAGASQKHKHLQLLPVDELWKLRKDDSEHPSLLDEVILPNIEARKWKVVRNDGQKVAVHRAPQFPFVHGVVVLDSDAGKQAMDVKALRQYAEYLLRAYEALLRHNKIDITALRRCADGVNEGQGQALCDESSAYNFVLTEDYMFIAARSRLRHFDSVNGMGFLGLLWASSDSSAELIRREGGLATLVGVTQPAIAR